MRFLGLLGLLAFVLAATVGCPADASDEIDQDRIWARYTLSYDENINDTVAMARFRNGGPTGSSVQIVGPAYIQFNGQSLPFSSLLNLHSRTLNGFVSSGTFEYGDHDDNVFSNNVTFDGIIDHPVGLTAISRLEDFEYHWQGPALTSNEEVELTIRSTGSSSEILAQFTGSGTGATFMLVPQSDLEEITDNEVRLVVRRRRDIEAPQTTPVGGRLVTMYRPLDLTVAMED